MIPSFKRSIIFILMNKTFKLQGNPKVLVLFFPHFQTSHEGLYKTSIS